ncbi:DUF1777-domain-containing protein [Daldinia caldariorum]|uniref:DUF1777-domain-containing protein n=1 Tax=Daldinia caldariorum TaxID=326644 RepID=UPI00200885D4|nr:DUF1777-domain-containing protein [Daldinia caldariorum]KAI1466359.1 DUF1777-domain-containing protein [Daldinia caldariorum]
MADQPRRRRNRPDSKQMWDESERRGGRHHEPDTRDRRDDRGRDRGGEDGRRDRDRRYRSRSRSPRQDRREKHRDRREPERARDQNIVWAKESDYHDRRRGERDRERERERDRRRDNRDEGATRGSGRDRSPRRSASPPTRSPQSRLDRHTHSHSNSPLPTRPRPNTGKPETGASSLQFKVGSKQQQQQDEEEASSGRGGKHDGQDEFNSRRGRTETPDRGDAMDEDKKEEGEDDDDDVVVEEDDSFSAMQAMMGFGGFGTTKGTHIPGNNAGAVRKEKKTEYRQYMNRVGGFNRPLSPTRE